MCYHVCLTVVCFLYELSLQTKLLHMEEELARGLVGQDEAIAVISKCIRLSRAGLRYHDRPLGVFLMIGPTVSALLWLVVPKLFSSSISS